MPDDVQGVLHVKRGRPSERVDVWLLQGASHDTLLRRHLATLTRGMHGLLAIEYVPKALAPRARS